MKNKSATYILSLLALVIWGTIFYKIFFQTEDNTETSSVTYPNKGPILESETDTFSIAMNYPDPFLKGKRSSIKKVPLKSSQKTGTSRHTSSNTVPPTKNVQSWPPIKFGGVIKKNATVIAIVNINGNTQLVKNGDIMNDVKLCSITEDSIIVSYQKEKKIIKKQ